MTISRGKQVKFKTGGDYLEGTENGNFILSDDLTIAFSSSFNSVSSAESPVAFKILSGILKEAGASWSGFISGEYKQLGFQIWTGTEPVTTSFTIQLSTDKDAYEEVVKPTMRLVKTCLPDEGSAGELSGPGPSIMSAFDSGEKMGNFRQLNCYIGAFKLPNVIIKRAQPTFSKTVDQCGWPIAATIEIEVSTIFTATTKMVDEQIINNYGKSIYNHRRNLL